MIYIYLLTNYDLTGDDVDCEDIDIEQFTATLNVYDADTTVRFMKPHMAAAGRAATRPLQKPIPEECIPEIPVLQDQADIEVVLGE